MSEGSGSDAIVVRGATKRFKKSTVRHEYTTLKTELVNLLLRRKPKAPPAQWIEALRGIDLSVPRGTTIGILGRNGSGKSTLLKLLTGIYGPTTGSIEVNGRVSALLDLGAGFHPDFSGRENILINGIILGMSRAEVRDRMDEIIAFSELGEFIDEPVRTYSSGMYMRLAFAVATHVDPDILIVDEILAVGDEHFSKKSMARMTEFKKSGKTIVLVTHDLTTVERWCDLAAWIDGGRIREVGRPAEVVAHYREAVRLAEASLQPFTPPALAQDGGALPAVLEAMAPPARSLPKLAGVKLRDVHGAEQTVLDTEHGCQLEIELQPQPDSVDDVSIAVELRGEQGQLLHRTTTGIDAFQLPRPIAPGTTLRLEIERIGLVSGQYTLEVHVIGADPAASQERAQVLFRVTSTVLDSGVFRPAHRWSLALPDAPQVRQGVSVARA